MHPSVQSNVSTHVCVPQSRSVPALWHSLTIPDCSVAASPRETSTFRFRKVACWVQPKHFLLLGQETQGKVSGLCVFLSHYLNCVWGRKNTKDTRVTGGPPLPLCTAGSDLTRKTSDYLGSPIVLTHKADRTASTWCQCNSLFVVPNSLH